MIKIANSPGKPPAAAPPFRCLRAHAELKLAPGTTTPSQPPSEPVEIFTLPLAGSLAIGSGSAPAISVGQARLDSSPQADSNPSTSTPAHFLRLHFKPRDASGGPLPRIGKFSEAERDNILCLLASPDARFGSLRISADTQIYTSRLGSGHQITYRIKPDHHLWLFIAAGELTILTDRSHMMNQGEFATISAESEIAIAARQESVFILLDLT